MSSERTALRMMLILSALAGAVWLILRALQLAPAASGAPAANRARESIRLCALGAVALSSFAATLFVGLRSALRPPPASTSSRER